MSNPTSSRLADSLTASRESLIARSNELAAASQWNEAKLAIEWAKQIDDMIAVLKEGNGFSNGKGIVARTERSITPNLPAGSRRDLPYHFVEGDRLVKVGARREGDGTYQHRVPFSDFEMVVEQLRELANAMEYFETSKLVDRCSIPKHEPLIVLAVLEEQGYVEKLCRGHWRFVDRRSFPQQASAIWYQIRAKSRA